MKGGGRDLGDGAGGGENTCRAARRRDPASAGSRTKKRGIVLIFRPWVIAGRRTLPYPPPNGRSPFLCPRSLSAGGAPRGTPAALRTRTSHPVNRRTPYLAPDEPHSEPLHTVFPPRRRIRITVSRTSRSPTFRKSVFIFLCFPDPLSLPTVS